MKENYEVKIYSDTLKKKSLKIGRDHLQTKSNIISKK